MRSAISLTIALLVVNVLTAVAAALGAADSQEALSSEEHAHRAWQFGGFADIGYLFDVHDSSMKDFRSRGTTRHLNELDLNMIGAYVRRSPSNWIRLSLRERQLQLHTSLERRLHAVPHDGRQRERMFRRGIGEQQCALPEGRRWMSVLTTFL
jgi:hypothetical protein